MFVCFFYYSTMLETIKKILELSEARISYLHNVDNKNWYKWYETYIQSIQDEMEEVIEEIKVDNTVHLEDELWDIFWAYFCLLHSLEEDGFIQNKEQVLGRCYKKFHERLWNPDNWNHWTWEEIKEKQKKELRDEHKKKHW